MRNISKETKANNENRCYNCGCCDSADGWCNLVGDYGFNVNKCDISDEEKWKYSSWNIHSEE